MVKERFKDQKMHKSSSGVFMAIKRKSLLKQNQDIHTPFGFYHRQPKCTILKEKVQEKKHCFQTCTLQTSMINFLL